MRLYDWNLCGVGFRVLAGPAKAAESYSLPREGLLDTGLYCHCLARKKVFKGRFGSS